VLEHAELSSVRVTNAWNKGCGRKGIRKGIPFQGISFRGNDMTGHARRQSAVSCEKWRTDRDAVWVVDSGGPRPESTIQTASRSLQLVFHGLLLWQSDRQADRQTDAARSVLCNNSAHLRTDCYTPWVKKGCHPNHGYNFVSSWRICKLLSLL